jgi:hypothetical protein
MIPYVIWLVFRNFRDQRVSVAGNVGKKTKKLWGETALAWFRGLFTLENVLGGGIVDFSVTVTSGHPQPHRIRCFFFPEKFP